MNTQRRRIIAILFILLTAGLIALFISLDSTHSSTKRISKQVSELFESGEYREAAEAFEKEVGPSEAYAFSLLCTAFEKYDSGDVKEARSYLNRWQNLQKKQSNILYSDEILQLTAEFRDKAEMEYKAVLAKKRRKRVRPRQAESHTATYLRGPACPMWACRNQI